MAGSSFAARHLSRCRAFIGVRWQGARLSKPIVANAAPATTKRQQARTAQAYPSFSCSKIRID